MADARRLDDTRWWSWVRMYAVTTTVLSLATARSPGYRVARIRPVSVLTGDRPRVAQAVFVVVVDTAVRAGLHAGWTRWSRRRSPADDLHLREVFAEAAALREEHSADRAAYNQALMDLYRREGVSPLSGLPVAPMVGATVVQVLLSSFMPWSGHRQTAAERLAGIIVVRA
jgi:hypothetical protein